MRKERRKEMARQRGRASYAKQILQTEERAVRSDTGRPRTQEPPEALAWADLGSPGPAETWQAEIGEGAEAEPALLMSPPAALPAHGGSAAAAELAAEPLTVAKRGRDESQEPKPQTVAKSRVRPACASCGKRFEKIAGCARNGERRKDGGVGRWCPGCSTRHRRNGSVCPPPAEKLTSGGQARLDGLRAKQGAYHRPQEWKTDCDKQPPCTKFTHLNKCMCKCMSGPAPFPGLPCGTPVVYGAAANCGVYVGALREGNTLPERVSVEADGIVDRPCKRDETGQSRHQSRQQFVAPCAGLILANGSTRRILTFVNVHDVHMMSARVCADVERLDPSCAR